MFFRLIASLSHTGLRRERLKLTNFHVTSLLSPASAPSPLLRSQERKDGGEGGCDTGVGSLPPLLQNLPASPFALALPDSTEVGEGEWHQPLCRRGRRGGTRGWSQTLWQESEGAPCRGSHRTAGACRHRLRAWIPAARPPPLSDANPTSYLSDPHALHLPNRSGSHTTPRGIAMMRVPRSQEGSGSSRCAQRMVEKNGFLLLVCCILLDATSGPLL